MKNNIVHPCIKKKRFFFILKWVFVRFIGHLRVLLLGHWNQSHVGGQAKRLYCPDARHSCLHQQTRKTQLGRVFTSPNYKALTPFNKPFNSPLSFSLTIPPIGPSLQPPTNLPPIQIAGTEVRPTKEAISARIALPSGSVSSSTTIQDTERKKINIGEYLVSRIL